MAWQSVSEQMQSPPIFDYEWCKRSLRQAAVEKPALGGFYRIVFGSAQGEELGLQLDLTRHLTALLLASHRLKHSVIAKDIVDSPRELLRIKMLELAQEALPAFPRIADIGAGSGNATMFFATACRAREVIPFEVDRKLHGPLKARVASEGLKNINLSHLGVALGAEAGSASIEPDSQGDSVRINLAIEGDVTLARLDALLAGGVDLIRVNVGRMTLAVLEGCERIVDAFQPQFFMEFSLDDLPGIHDWVTWKNYRVASARLGDGFIGMLLQPRRVRKGILRRLLAYRPER
jgi:FkbM family methyltransferase